MKEDLKEIIATHGFTCRGFEDGKFVLPKRKAVYAIVGVTKDTSDSNKIFCVNYERGFCKAGGCEASSNYELDEKRFCPYS